MTITGKDSQVGFGIESTYGTRVAPASFYRFTSTTLKRERALIRDEGIIAGRLTPDNAPVCEGDVTVDGDLVLPLFRGTKLNTIFEWMMGAVSGAGTSGDPFLFTPGTDLDSASIQVGRGGTGGTVHPEDFTGCKAASWSITAQAGSKSEITIGVVGQDSVTDQTLATATLTKPNTYSFAHASMTIGGSSRKVKSLTFSGDNGLESGRRFIGSQTISEPVDGDLRSYTAEATVEFEDHADYATTYRAASLALSTIEGVWTDGANILTITMQGFLESAPIPAVNGRGPLEYTLSLMGHGATDADTCTIQQNTA